MTTHHVLGVFAHPDDETIMAGGTIALLRQQAVRVHLLIATRGEGGEAGEPPVIDDRRELGAVREAELRCAAEALGAASVSLLGYIDPDIGPDEELGAFAADFDTLVGQIAQTIGETGAEAVISHGPDGEYGHPAHKLIYRATAAAVTRHAPQVAHYTVAAAVPGIEDRLWNESRRAHLVLDITPWQEAKIAAMECHVTQHALFKRRRKLKTVREAVRLTEPYHREWPSVNGGGPDDWFAQLLQANGALATWL